MNAGGHWDKALKLNMHAANYLKQLSRYNINFELWYQNSEIILKSAFGMNSNEYGLFHRIKFHIKNSNEEPASYRNIYVSGLEESIDLFTKCVQSLTEKNTSFDFLVNVTEYFNVTALSETEKEKILSQLKSMNDALVSNSKSIDDWQRKLQQNKIVHLLNKLVCLYTMEKNLTGQENL